MSVKKNSMIIRLEGREQVELLTNEQSGILFKALLRYAAGDELPEMDATTKMCFMFIRQQIDRDNAAYNERCEKNAEAARRRWDANACERMQTHANGCERMQTDANACYPDPDPDTDLKKEPPKGGKKESAPRFHPPSVDEVMAYAIEKGYNVDAERFVDFYTSKGWKVGSAPMKDWKAAVRNWARSERQGQAAKPKNNSNFQSRDIDLDNLLKAGGLYG